MTMKMESLLDFRELDDHPRYNPPNPADNAYAEKPPKREPDYYCLGRSRIREGENEGKWKYCYSRAGAGTTHTGHGRCKRHGGSAPSVENRYAAMLNDNISGKIAKFLNDPNPLDLRAELAAARALFEDFTERYDEFVDAVIAWHASFHDDRRGLHDAPLYHFDAIRHAYRSLAHDRFHEATDEDLHRALEEGVRAERMEWAARMAEQDRRSRLDLKVEKPVKVLDISHAARILKIITEITTTIMKHEREAFLSIFAVQMLMESYGEHTKKVLNRHLRRLGVNDGETLERILKDIASAWESTPVLETSVPRLAAERKQQERYLGS